jgi:hypothetical protein
MKKALVQIQGVLAELDKNLTVKWLRKARDAKSAEQKKRCEGRKSYGQSPEVMAGRLFKETQGQTRWPPLTGRNADDSPRWAFLRFRMPCIWPGGIASPTWCKSPQSSASRKSPAWSCLGFHSSGCAAWPCAYTLHPSPCTMAPAAPSLAPAPRRAPPRALRDHR